MKKLGFGCMRMPTKKGMGDGFVNYNRAGEMMDYYLNKGFVYFDTAFMYHKGNSEKVVGKMLGSRHDRESFLLADKMPVGMIVRKGMTERIFEKQKAKCNTEYFDYYLLHCLNKDNYARALKYNVFDILADKKAKGEIRKLGFSFHDTAEVLDKILTEHPEMEFVQLQINYLDWEDEKVQSRLCYETARKHGKDIIVMEPVKGGKLANVPDEVAKIIDEAAPGVSPACFALGFTASLEGVIMVLSGMSNMQQLKENVEYFDNFKPFGEKEFKAAKKAVEIFLKEKAIPCTDCKYCVEGCPKSINIPEYFKCYNTSLSDMPKGEMMYKQTAEKSGSISECISCGKCEKTCPQKIKITKEFKKIEKKFG